MITKIFKPLFITLFLTAFSFGLKAQDDKAPAKWELAVVFADIKSIHIIQTNAPYTKILFSNFYKFETTHEEILKQVQNLVNDGWVITDIEYNSAVGLDRYNLRRKLK